MIRLSIAMFHTFLAVATTSGAALLAAQGAANRAWEEGFYGEVSVLTAALEAGAWLTVAFGASWAVSAWLWFVGVGWAGWVLLGAALLTVPALPLTTGMLLGLASALVLADLWVLSARRRRPPRSGAPPG